MSEKPRVTILYCTQCNWLLRAGWMAQELLSTFADTLGEVALIPGTGGNFEIRIDGELVWERKRDGGFPGPKELKQRIRHVVEGNGAPAARAWSDALDQLAELFGDGAAVLERRPVLLRRAGFPQGDVDRREQRGNRGA